MELDGGHSPLLTRPAELADVLVGLAGRHRRLGDDSGTAICETSGTNAAAGEPRTRAIEHFG
jgi:hypothetical protein